MLLDVNCDGEFANDTLFDWKIPHKTGRMG